METFVQPSCASLTRRRVRLLLQFSIAVASVCWFCALVPGAQPANQPHRVVVVVWDGMRPDLVSEQNSPALWKLAKSGVIFRNHHSVYPSVTIVNGTAINTGDYPEHSGVLANHDYLPAIDAKKSIDIENVNVVRRGDEVSHDKYLRVPTIAELIHSHGGTTAVATAKTVGLLFDRHCRSEKCQYLFAGESVLPAAVESIIKVLGPFPPPNAPQKRDAWTAAALRRF